MAFADILANQHRTIRQFTLEDLKDISDEEVLWKPPAGMNPIIWLVGHICMAEDGLVLGLCKGRPLIREEFRNMFTRGSQVAEDLSMYPPVSEIIAKMADIHEQAVEYISGVTEEEMDKPLRRDMGVPFLKKRGDALIQAQRHEAYHQAQIRQIRRLYADKA